MDNQLIFRDLLREAQETAKERGGELTAEEIDRMFANARLGPEQMAMVYAYLTGTGIRIAGASGEGRPPFGAAAMDFPEEEMAEGIREDGLKRYLEQIAGLPSLDPEEEMRLFEEASRGNPAARNQLAGLYLTMVFDIASELETEKVASDDLIQEGNLALLQILDRIERADSLAAYQARLINELYEGMKNAVDNLTAEQRGTEEMISLMNQIRDTAKQLEEELGRPASVDELAAFLGMDAERIRNIIAMAGE